MATLLVKDAVFLVQYTVPGDDSGMPLGTTITSWTALYTGAELMDLVDFTTDEQADPETRVGLMSAAITRQIEAYTRRAFNTRTVVEHLHGNGGSEIVPTWAPIVSITELKRAILAKDLADVTADTEGEHFDCDGDSGRLWMYNGVFFAGRSNIKLTYVAGYDDDDHADMQLARQALILQAVSTWREWDKQMAGMQDQTVGELTENRLGGASSPALIQSVKDLLQPLVRYAA